MSAKRERKEEEEGAPSKYMKITVIDLSGFPKDDDDTSDQEECPPKMRGKGMLLPFCDHCGINGVKKPRKTRNIRLQPQTWKCSKCVPESTTLVDHDIDDMLLDENCIQCHGPFTEKVTLGPFRWMCRDCLIDYVSDTEDEQDMVTGI